MLNMVLTFHKKMKRLLPNGWGAKDILPGVKRCFAAFIITMWRVDKLPDELVLEIILHIITTSPNHAINPLGKFNIPDLIIYGGTSLCLLTGSPIPPSDWDLRYDEHFLPYEPVFSKGIKVISQISETLGHQPKIIKKWKSSRCPWPNRVFIEARAGQFKFSLRMGSLMTTDADLFESSIEFSLRTGKMIFQPYFPNFNPRRFRFQWITPEVYDETINCCSEWCRETVRERWEMFLQVQEERFQKHQTRLAKVGVRLLKVHVDPNKAVSVLLYRRSYLCME